MASSPIFPNAPPLSDIDDDDVGTYDVYEVIHELNQLITTSIDAPLSWAELKAPNVNYTIVRPIVERFTPAKDDDDESPSLSAILYALMANRIQFLNLADADLSNAPIQETRADLCELLAIKILRTNKTVSDEAELTSQLVQPLCALDGAPASVLAKVDGHKEHYSARNSALELAIQSSAKKFLASPMIQHLIGLIYNGDLTYTPSRHNSLIPDNYIDPRENRQKRTRSLLTRGVPPTDDEPEEDEIDIVEVYPYNPYKAGWLDYQRLRVPRWSRWVEFMSFAGLIILFVATLSSRNMRHLDRPRVVEIIFMVYNFGIILDEYAGAKEHGVQVYLASVWNTFDLTYVAIFLAYFVTRLIGFQQDSEDIADLSFDILSLGACILFPRLAFILVQDNVVLLSLVPMISTFIGFMALTVVAFSGIWYCLLILGQSSDFQTHPYPSDPWTPRSVFRLLMNIWFGGGLSLARSTNRDSAHKIHPVLGTPLLIVFALICTMFLIPMMTSLISNKFSEVKANSQQEHLYQRVVSTVEGVKSDSVFSYMPPFNVLAIILLVPLSWVVSPRTLHQVNVLCIQVTNFPFLIFVSTYERHRYRVKHRAIRLSERDGGAPKSSGFLDSFLGSASERVITAAFELTPPARVKQEPKDSAAEDAKDGKKKEEPATPKDKDAKPGKKVPAPLDLTSAHTPSRHSALQPTPLSSAFGVGRVYGRGSNVAVSTEDWDEMRESQKRLEELVNKVLAVTGGAGGSSSSS